jgi:hypothetical protein
MNIGPKLSPSRSGLNCLVLGLLLAFLTMVMFFSLNGGFYGTNALPTTIAALAFTIIGLWQSRKLGLFRRGLALIYAIIPVWFFIKVIVDIMWIGPGAPYYLP